MQRKIRTTSEGKLLLGDCEAATLAAEYHTPLYVMEEDVILDAMRAYVHSVNEFYGGKGLVCYASKAFSCKEIYRMAKAEGLGVDVASQGELYTALSVDFPPEHICFHGNNKTPHELRYALTSKVGRIVVDNLTELSLLSSIAEELGIVANILFRIKPGVEAHTHDMIKTGQIDSKFGLALETGEAMEAIKLALNTKNVHLRGVHCHIGSQILEVDAFETAAAVMMDFIAAVKAETGFLITDLNLGGGFGIRYTNEDDPLPYVEYMKAVSQVVKAKTVEHSLPQPFILLEPGRSIVGEAGTTLYTVGSVKEIPGIRTYVAVDGSMCDNPRYSLYGAKYDFLLADRANAEPDTVVTIAGKCCETDLLGEHVSLPTTKPGDLIAVLSTGAYNFAMASHYNRTLLPPVIMVKDGKARVIVKGETLDDLLRHDI